MDTLMLYVIILTIGFVAIVVITKCRNWQLLMFFCFYCILPSYFALEVSESFPLLSASRVLILLLTAYVMTQKTRYSFREVLKNQKMKLILSSYFVFRIIALCTHLYSSPVDVIKEFFTIGFEEMLVLYIVVLAVKNLDVFDKCLRMFVYGGISICIIGIIQSLTSFNLAYLLNTVHREMLQTSAVRLGFTRAEASFGHPVYFGEFCVLILPIISYLYDNTKKNKYLLFILIDLLALFLSNSRGAILPGLFILVLMILGKKGTLRRRYLRVSIMVVLGFMTITLLVPPIGEAVSSIFMSIMNTFGARYSIADYGGNELGLDSRVNQLSGIIWVIKQGAVLFGFGPNAHMKGLVSYFFNNNWHKLDTVDVGYVGFFLSEGLIGTIGQMVLIIGLIKRAYAASNINDSSNLNNALLLCFVAHSLLLLSAVGLELTFWCLVSVFVAYNNVKSSEVNLKATQT